MQIIFAFNLLLARSMLKVCSQVLMVFSKAFLATTEKKFYEDLTFNIENKYIYIFIAIIIIYIFICFLLLFFFMLLFCFFTSSIAHAQHELSWLMGKIYRSM